MANHVSNSITVRTNDAGQKVWDDIIKTLNDNRDPEQPWGEIFLSVLYPDAPENPDREWMHENVGPKWAYAQDWDESFMLVQSAWSPVDVFCQYISEKISKADPDGKVTLTYEDEFYNFVGVAEYEHGEEISDISIEIDELLERLRNDFSELADLWDADECEWTDEDAAWDIINENIGDAVYEWQEQNQ